MALSLTRDRTPKLVLVAWGFCIVLPHWIPSFLWCLQLLRAFHFAFFGFVLLGAVECKLGHMPTKGCLEILALLGSEGKGFFAKLLPLSIWVIPGSILSKMVDSMVGFRDFAEIGVRAIAFA